MRDLTGDELGHVYGAGGFNNKKKFKNNCNSSGSKSKNSPRTKHSKSSNGTKHSKNWC